VEHREWPATQAVAARSWGLTLPSNGHTTAGHNASLRQGWSRRCVPLMSNVRPANARTCFGIVCGCVMHRHLSAACGTSGRRLQCRAERFETEFTSRGGSPDRFALSPLNARTKLAGSHPVVVGREACLPSSRLRRTASTLVCVLQCHRTSGRHAPRVKRHSCAKLTWEAPLLRNLGCLVGACPSHCGFS